MTSAARRIDVHHHFLPPEFIAEVSKHPGDWTGGPGVPRWNLDIARETMARQGIATAIASVVPHVHWGDGAAASRWARHCNEFAARAIADEPARFGGFATLPLPDVARALAELEYALDTLRLDGVLLFSSYGARYLGDADFDELFQELERRRVTAFIHPNTMPPTSQASRLALPPAMVDYVFDTTRAIASLLCSGSLERYPSIRFIVSHAGGAVPFLAARFALVESLPAYRERLPNGAIHCLQRLYYDTALSSSPYALAALRALVPPSQILFGSDFPMASEAIAEHGIRGLESSEILDGAAQEAIARGNALRLFPRLASL